jgi:hypothetical protein
MEFKLVLKTCSLLSLCLAGLMLNLVLGIETTPNPIISEENSMISLSNDLENFTIIVLPDTQYYSDNYPWIFENQTQWIIENRKSKNIVFVTHLGDIVDHWWDTEEWDNANNSLSKLGADLPFGVLPGNHDGAEQSDDLSNYNNYFGFSRFNNQSWYGGAYQNINSNNYQLFSAAENDYLIFHIQFNPSGEVLIWASDVISQFPSRKVIVSTHSYVHGFYSNSRSGIGDKIWEKLVEPHADQVFLVLSGHYENEVRITSLANGYFVHQLLSDYQDRPNGGNGWLRIIKFSPSIDEISIKTYSPYLNKYETDSNSQFLLEKKITENDFTLPIILFIVWILLSPVIAFSLIYFLKRRLHKK